MSSDLVLKRNVRPLIEGREEQLMDEWRDLPWGERRKTAKPTTIDAACEVFAELGNELRDGQTMQQETIRTLRHEKEMLRGQVRMLVKHAITLRGRSVIDASDTLAFLQREGHVDKDGELR